MKPVSYLYVPAPNGYIRYAVLGFVGDQYLIRLDNGWHHTQLVDEDWIESKEAVHSWQR
jgi:hypothetical protein